jgi:peptidoglycan/LPS O-acetylase OafA/YrhL
LNHAEPIFGWSLLGGVIGVDLFFVLSGFLITTLLLERNPEPLRRFYARRALRLLPAVYVLVVVVTAIAALRYHQGAMYLRADAWVLTYSMNWASVLFHWDALMLRHLWTLAVEEQFYLLFPLPFLVCWRRWPARMMPALIGLIGLTAVWRATEVLLVESDRFSERLDMHVDGLLAGVALALARWNGANLRRVGAWWPAALVVFLGAAALTDYHARLHYALVLPIVTVASVVLIAGAITHAPRVLTVPTVVAIGVYSYSLYLWHVPMFDLIGGIHSASPVMKAGLGLTAAVGVSLGSYYLVERPFLMIKNRIGGRLDSTAPARNLTTAQQGADGPARN